MKKHIPTHATDVLFDGELIDRVENMLFYGVDKEMIRNVLIEEGYQENIIFLAYCSAKMIHAEIMKDILNS